MCASWVPKTTPASRICWEGSWDPACSCTRKCFTRAKEHRTQPAEGRGTRGEVWRIQATGFQSPLPVDGAGGCLLWSPRHPLPGTPLSPRCPEDKQVVQHQPHCLCRQPRYTTRSPPETPALDASHLQPSMLTLLRRAAYYVNCSVHSPESGP